MNVIETNRPKRADHRTWTRLFGVAGAALFLLACPWDDAPERGRDTGVVAVDADTGAGDAGSDIGADAPGDITPGECTERECGPAPGMPNWTCEDGSIGGPVCERGDDGACGWRIRECDPFGCGPEDCGPAPGMPNWICEDGSVGGPVCEEAGPGECRWFIHECPPDRGCYSHEDCDVGELCNAVDVCLPDPSCPECDVCYGWCEPIACPEIWDPVCGVDGETYANPCFARVAHAEVAYEGPCVECRRHTDCPVGELCDGGFCWGATCPAVWAPVCGADGNTYGNACQARLAHVDVAYEGECGSVECRSNDDCGVDAICYPPTHTCRAPCEIACLVYDPVCGTDGTTYACGEEDAWCHGARVAYDGECSAACRTDDDCAVGEVCAAGVCDSIACPAIYDPVCGVDGRTYGNACEARAAHVDVAHEGECETPPECRSNDHCSGDLICFPPTHECRPACEVLCVDYDPVCGTDGRTYACGAADAWCHGAEVAYRGECVDSCEHDSDCPVGEVCEAAVCEPAVCPRIWDPVCGVDGHTYSNACAARAAHVDIDYEGECRVDCEAHEDCDVWELCVDGMCVVTGCPDVWDPVCGVDGVTYGNACEARAVHVEVAYEGECESEPECRTNDDCDGDLVCYPPTDTCEPACAIACFVYDPVCGADGRTYGCGSADAWCHGVEVAYDGECGTTAECTERECGPAPLLPDILCPDGSTAGAVCERDEDGTCGWFVTECPDTIGCHGDDACPDGMRCNAGTVCLPDPTCPACDVCYGWCVWR